MSSEPVISISKTKEHNIIPSLEATRYGLQIVQYLCNCKGVSERRDYDDVIKCKKKSALLAICAGNSPVAGELTHTKASDAELDVLYHLRLELTLSKQSWG